MRKREIKDINLVIALINSTNKANENIYYLQRSLELAEIDSKIEESKTYQRIIINLKKVIIVVEKLNYKEMYILRLEEK